ncbi:MAG: CoA pyrophosphatase [Bacteroidales bacterium]|jgi:8-oxo-dGTP pyrophosphatase MutT (NUDIX family)
MIFSEFIDSLKSALALPLPGTQAQLKMTSNRRLREMMDMQQMDKAIKSSVLILLYPGRENSLPTFVVTLRQTYNGIHSGQISLPGGRFESSDKDLLETALRETNEEIGVDPFAISVIGKLTELYIPPSNYIVQPFVGFTVKYPEFHIQQTEVEKIFEIDVTQLMDESAIMEKEVFTTSGQLSAPSFAIDRSIIWGATAMILSEFKEILRKTSL